MNHVRFLSIDISDADASVNKNVLNVSLNKCTLLLDSLHCDCMLLNYVHMNVFWARGLLPNKLSVFPDSAPQLV